MTTNRAIQGNVRSHAQLTAELPFTPDPRYLHEAAEALRGGVRAVPRLDLIKLLEQTLVPLRCTLAPAPLALPASAGGYQLFCFHWRQYKMYMER